MLYTFRLDGVRPTLFVENLWPTTLCNNIEVCGRGAILRQDATIINIDILDNEKKTLY